MKRDAHPQSLPYITFRVPSKGTPHPGSPNRAEGAIEVTGRQGRRSRKVLDDLKERRIYSYLMEESLDSTMCRARFGRGFRPVARQTTK